MPSMNWPMIFPMMEVAIPVPLTSPSYVQVTFVPPSADSRLISLVYVPSISEKLIPVFRCLSCSLSMIHCEPFPTSSLTQLILAPTPDSGPSNVVFVLGSFSIQGDHLLKFLKLLICWKMVAGCALTTIDRSMCDLGDKNAPTMATSATMATTTMPTILMAFDFMLKVWFGEVSKIGK